jgi:hypothetical protein
VDFATGGDHLGRRLVWCGGAFHREILVKVGCRATKAKAWAARMAAMIEFPVFDQDRRILGFLEVHQSQVGGTHVYARCRPPLSVSLMNPLDPSAIVDAPPVVELAWDVVSVVRGDGRNFECRCLHTAAPHEHLDLLPGWTWFPERYGQDRSRQAADKTTPMGSTRWR